MKRELLIILGLAAITLIAFSGVRECGFVNIDDTTYIVNNPHVTGGLTKAHFIIAWTTYEQGLYLPLTSMSLMLDGTFFGPNPLGYHCVNLAFHIANAILLYLFFRSATGAVWRSALVAAIFAVHPLRVESVVWVIERKDVLSGFFGLLAMLAYLRYTRTLNWAWYVIVLFLFAATLLAKQSLTTLPCLLLLLDYWPLGRWLRGPAPVSRIDIRRRSALILVIEKLPLLMMSVVVGIVAASHPLYYKDVAGVTVIPLAWRLENVPVSYMRYLVRMFWFGGLTVFYLCYKLNWIEIGGSCVVLFSITAWCLSQFRRRPWLLIGWLWFLGVLVPMIGIVQIGGHSLADRYTYFSTVGLLVMLAWSIPNVASGNAKLPYAAVGTVLGILVVCTMAQTRYWQNSITLFEHNIEVAGSNATGELNLGVALLEYSMQLKDPDNQRKLAFDHLHTAIELDPMKPRPHWAMALALAQDHRIDDAIAEARLAVHYQDDKADWRIELADLLCQKGDFKEAAEHAGVALKIDWNSPRADYLLGLSLCEQGQVKEGKRFLKSAIALQPDFPEAKLALERFAKSK